MILASARWCFSAGLTESTGMISCRSGPETSFMPRVCHRLTSFHKPGARALACSRNHSAIGFGSVLSGISRYHYCQTAKGNIRSFLYLNHCLHPGGYPELGTSSGNAGGMDNLLGGVYRRHAVRLAVPGQPTLAATADCDPAGACPPRRARAILPAAACRARSLLTGGAWAGPAPVAGWRTRPRKERPSLRRTPR